MTVIEDPEPLKQDYTPEEIVGREQEQQIIRRNIGSRNLHIQGPRGTGKTLVARKLAESIELTCYVSCMKHDTQYKVLQQLVSQIGREPVNTGYHTSDLQRKLEDRTGVLDTAIILDEFDFLLLNDGDDLLYFLSRLENTPQILTITSNTGKLEEKLEPRTLSSLHPRRIGFSPYTGEQVYKILSDRASESLKPRSVHRSAATYIASKTQNAEKAITWLKTASQEADNKVTEQLVERTREQARQVYAENQLQQVSQQHRILYQAIKELSEEKGPVIRTGDIYSRYGEVAENRGMERLSNRRISDLLKQLELLNLLDADTVG